MIRREDRGSPVDMCCVFFCRSRETLGFALARGLHETILNTCILTIPRANSLRVFNLNVATYSLILFVMPLLHSGCESRIVRAKRAANLPVSTAGTAAIGRIQSFFMCARRNQFGLFGGKDRGGFLRSHPERKHDPKESEDVAGFGPGG